MKNTHIGPFIGINNRLQDSELRTKEGDWLRDAVNVDVDNAGKIVRRRALTLLQAMTGAHSIFGDLFVRGGSMYRYTTGPYHETLVSVLGSNNAMSWCKAPDGCAYFSNGVDSGRITPSGSVLPWALPTPASPSTTSIAGTLDIGWYQIAISYINATTGEEGGVSPSSNVELTSVGGLRVTLPGATTGATHVAIYVSTTNGSIPILQTVVAASTTTYDVTAVTLGGRDAMQRYELPLPAGSKVFMANGRLCVLSGKTLYYGIPHRFGYYLPVEGRIEFPDNLTIAIENQSGVYVATTRKTHFIAGADLGGENAVQDVLPYGAVPGTEFVLRDKENIVVGWFGQKGFVFADKNGEVKQVSADAVDLTAPAGGHSEVFEANGYRRVVSCGWCCNTANGAMTRYVDYDTTSESNGVVTRADGLYATGGNGPVDASVSFGKANFGAENLKNFSSAYLGCWSELPLELTVGLPTSASYTYSARSCSDIIKEHRVDLGRGLRANWFDLSVANTSGSDFSLVKVSFTVSASQRRI